MIWKERQSLDDCPEESGWYRIMVSGDSELIDGHYIYSFDDYETWAYFTKASPDEFEDFIGGYKGSFCGTHDEENETIFAYVGPFVIPPRI